MEDRRHGARESLNSYHLQSETRIMSLKPSRLFAVGGAVAAVSFGAYATMRPAVATADASIVVYKSPTCGCCHKWVEHLQANDFDVTVHDVVDINEVKTQMGVTNDLAACHTAVLGKYIVEGHVPASIIERLIKEQPAISGIAVPGMPPGSPGMESPNPQPYNVIAFDAAGNRSVFATVNP